MFLQSTKNTMFSLLPYFFGISILSYLITFSTLIEACTLNVKT